MHLRLGLDVCSSMAARASHPSWMSGISSPSSHGSTCVSLVLVGRRSDVSLTVGGGGAGGGACSTTFAHSLYFRLKAATSKFVSFSFLASVIFSPSARSGNNPFNFLSSSSKSLRARSASEAYCSFPVLQEARTATSCICNYTVKRAVPISASSKAFFQSAVIFSGPEQVVADVLIET